MSRETDMGSKNNFHVFDISHLLYINKLVASGYFKFSEIMTICSRLENTKHRLEI